MRPVSVRFQCFGPYMQEQYVNFEELERDGGVVRSAPMPKDEDDQLSMLDLRSQQVCAALSSLSVETLTPIEAMNELYKLKQMLN